MSFHNILLDLGAADGNPVSIGPAPKQALRQTYSSRTLLPGRLAWNLGGKLQTVPRSFSGMCEGSPRG